MARDWDQKDKALQASFAIAKLAERLKVPLVPRQATRLSSTMERAALRFHLTGGMARQLAPKKKGAKAAQISPSVVAGLIDNLRNDLDRARLRAWQVQHAAPPILRIDGEAVQYGTAMQNAGAAFAADFLDRPEAAEIHPLGMIAALEAMIDLCASQIAKAGNAKPTNISVITEHHRFCWVLSDIFHSLARRRAVASDGAQETQFGRSPFTEFVAAGWRLSGFDHPPGAHSISTMLSERVKLT